MKHFPKFIYSELKDTDSSGAIVIHLNFPRAVFRVHEYEYSEPSISISTDFWIDKPTSETGRKTIKEALQWLQKFLIEKDSKQTKK